MQNSFAHSFALDKNISDDFFFLCCGQTLLLFVPVTQLLKHDLKIKSYSKLSWIFDLSECCMLCVCVCVCAFMGGYLIAAGAPSQAPGPWSLYCAGKQGPKKHRMARPQSPFANCHRSGLAPISSAISSMYWIQYVWEEMSISSASHFFVSIEGIW